MCPISASQPMMLITSLPNWEQPSNAFRKLALSWQCTNVTLVPPKLNFSDEKFPHKASNPRNRTFWEKAPIDIMTKHSYLPTTNELHSLLQILRKLRKCITLKCATTKLLKPIGKLERTHASLKTNLKMACGECMPTQQPNNRICWGNPKQDKILIDKTKQNIMQSYMKYKEYYDRKVKAAPLKEN